MGMISRLEHIWERDKNYALRYAIVFSGSVCIHAVLALMFAMAGRMTFAWMNGFSIILYALWLYVFSRKTVSDGMLLVPYVDVVVHSCVYNQMLGIGPAFFMYSITIIPLSFFLSIRDAKNKHAVGISSILAILVIVLTLAALSSTPLAPFTDAMIERQFFQINLIMCAMLLGLHTWEFLSETRTTQTALSLHAEYDQLTGLRNRYSIAKETEKIQGTQYCAIMCDIDDFKRVNDTFGHATGDVLLSEIGNAIQSSIRRDDLSCRWGGEEFLLVIKADLDTARVVIGRIQKKMTAISVNVEDNSVAVTMTYGIADCLEGESFEKVVAAADANLLRGKRSGKNCVVTSCDETIYQSNLAASEELDKSSLTGAIFAAFAATSDSTYIYICNLSTNVSRWSKTAVEYFGLPSEYMQDAGNIWLGFVHPDDRAAYAQDIEAVFSGKKRMHDVTYRARNKNGEYVTCVCRGVVTEGEAGQPKLFAGTMTNLGVAVSDHGQGR